MTEPITPANKPAGDPPTDPPAPPAVPHLQNKPDPAPEPPKPGPPPATDDGQGKADEPLGENGLKALQAERERANEFEKQLKALAPLQKIAAALGDGDPVKGKSELEQLAERQAQIEQELTSERQARWKLEAISEHKLPAEWADRLRGATRDELIADAASLAKLLPAAPQSQFQGTADGGVRDQGVQKSQLTRADLAGMKPAQIEAARKEGRLNQLMGIKQ
jgi:hypothetical protein